MTMKYEELNQTQKNALATTLVLPLREWLEARTAFYRDVPISVFEGDKLIPPPQLPSIAIGVLRDPKIFPTFPPDVQRAARILLNSSQPAG